MANEKMVVEKDQIVGGTGNRFSEETKKEAVKYLEKEDTVRGNIKRAMALYGCSYIALRSWLNRYGSDSKPVKVKKSVSAKVASTPKGDGKRGRKANPSIFALRLLMKMKKANEREGKQIEKAIAKIGKV